MTCKPVTHFCDEIRISKKIGSLLLFTTITVILVEIMVTQYSESRKKNKDNLHTSFSPVSNIDDYFNRRYFHITRESIGYDAIKEYCDFNCQHRRLIHEYNMSGVIRCLDFLLTKRNRQPLHIAFIGDSIIRHHFLSFLRWIPDYDRKMSNNATLFVARQAFHGDRSVTSHLLDNLKISYYWRNLIKSDILTDFQRWASTSNYRQVPDFIILGITAHHMADVTSSLQEYKNMFENKLLPLINQSLHTHAHQEIIWLRQSPTIEQRTPSIYYAIHNGKIMKYNDEIRQMFKKTRVVMWDTANEIVEEYQRACALTAFERRDSSLYVNCNDFIHPGFGAIALESLLIFNHICRK